MNIESLSAGQPFYILRRGERPVLEIGTVKTKSQPRAKFPTTTPNLMNGLTVQQVVDITATVNGRDEVFSEIPTNVEIAQRGNDTFSGDREAMLQAVDAMLQTSRKALDMVSYHKSVIAESERMMETLNPRYAEEKKQARTIKTLEERQAATEEKLDSILAILTKLDSPS